tara:strand:+ start:34724 stop:35878 length:1155 start_codon:yes stop_codon:yes gene_type:complete
MIGMLRFCITKIFIYIFTFNSICWGGQYFYIIKQNDNASVLLHKAQLKPIYTKQGTLISLRKTNSKISDINYILPGQRLVFSSTLADQAVATGAIQILASGEIVFHQPKVAQSSIEQRKIASETNQNYTSESPISKAPITFAVNSSPETTARAHTSNDFINQPQSELKFAIGMGYSRLDSSQNSASASFISKAIPSAFIQWKQHWSPSWQTHMAWQTSSIEYEETDRGTLEGSPKVSTSGFGFGATKVFESKLYLAADVGASEQVFATSDNPGTAKLHTRPITYLGLSFGKKILEVRNLSLSAELAGKFLMKSTGSDFDASSGLDYSAKVFIEHKLKSMSVFACGIFSKTNQNTSQSNQGITDLKSQFGISIPLGGGGADNGKK